MKLNYISLQPFCSEFLYLFCSTTLQYKYKRFGCRKSNSRESLEKLKSKNAEIAIWNQLITESVLLFGCKVSPKQTFFTGLNRKLGFNSFAPRWNAPFSSTVDINVAIKFSDAEGVILKLEAGPGSMDRYYDVEWLSDFEWERERLFITAFQLRIADIGYFEGEVLLQNEGYLKALTLFSSLFRGDFLSESGRKKKGRKSIETMLLHLITNYKANNNLIPMERERKSIKKEVLNLNQRTTAIAIDIKRLKDGDDSISSRISNSKNQKISIQNKKVDDSSFTAFRLQRIAIPLYIQQLFYQLIRSFKHDHHHSGFTRFIIPSEYAMLSESLKAEFFKNVDIVEGSTSCSTFSEPLQSSKSLNDTKEETLKAVRKIKRGSWTFAPFLGSICRQKRMEWLTEFEWVIGGREFEDFKNAPSDRRVFSPKFEYEIKERQSVCFQMWLKRKTGGTESAGIGIIVDELKGIKTQTVNGKMALMIDEMKWIKNDYVLKGMNTRTSRGSYAFRSSLLERLEAMTIRMAVHFKVSRSTNKK